jgi:hypothetical protein
MCFQNYPSESSLQMTTNVLKYCCCCPVYLLWLLHASMRRVSVIDRIDQGFYGTETVQTFGVDMGLHSIPCGRRTRSR